MGKHTASPCAQTKDECDGGNTLKTPELQRRRSSVQRNLEILQQRFQHLHAVPRKKVQLPYNRRLSTAIMEKTQFQAKNAFWLSANGQFAHNTAEFPKNTSRNFLQDLRKDYVLPAQQSDEAISNNELYSDKNILKRESLKFDKGIRDVLGKLWSLVDKDNDNTISKDEYYELHRRLLRALVGKVSKEEEIVMCDEDWIQDIGDFQHNEECTETFGVDKTDSFTHIKVMNKGQFINAFFRMVDLWTEKVCVNEYFTFLSDAFKRISTTDGKGRYKFRNIDNIKHRSRRASMVVIDGKVRQADASNKSETKKKTEKKSKTDSKGDKEGWWCRLHGTGPWWRRLKGRNEQRKSHSKFQYKCSDITFMTSGEEIKTKRHLPFQRQPYGIHANSVSIKTVQDTQSYCRTDIANQLPTRTKPGRKLKRNPKLHLSLPDFHRHINTSLERDKPINDGISVAEYVKRRSKLLELHSHGSSHPTSTKPEATHLPLIGNSVTKSKWEEGSYIAQKKCSKVCNGNYEMKWILKRNYSDDWYDHMQISQRSFSFGFFLAGDRRPKCIRGGTNHQSRMIPANNCRTKNPRSIDFDTFIQNIYAYKKQNPDLSMASLLERVCLTELPQSVHAQEPVAVKNDDKILTMKLPTSGNISIANMRAKPGHNSILRNQSHNTTTNKRRKRAKKVKKKRHKQFLRIQGTQPGYTNIANKFSRKPILRFRRLNRPQTSPQPGFRDRTS